MLTISPRSAQRSFWKLIDEAREAPLSHPLHLRALPGLCGEYVTTILARSTSHRSKRIVAFITEPQVIDRILDHVRRTATGRSRSRGPPARARMVRAAAGSGSA